MHKRKGDIDIKEKIEVQKKPKNGSDDDSNTVQMDEIVVDNDLQANPVLER